MEETSLEEIDAHNQMTSQQAVTAHLLTLNHDVLRLIGEYLDPKSKWQLKRVNLQTFAPAWPIFLCQYSRHIPDTTEITRQEIFTQRNQCILDKGSRCTRCKLITCFDCADQLDIPSCDLCANSLCRRCQRATRIRYYVCLCGIPFCSNCGRSEFRGDPACDDCIEFQLEDDPSGYDDFSEADDPSDVGDASDADDYSNDEA